MYLQHKNENICVNCPYNKTTIAKLFFIIYKGTFLLVITICSYFETYLLKVSLL